ncbi:MULTISPECIES: phage baseplate assembly protein V [Pseudoalteromonas]|uniref:Baseplate assembly protein n=1 Tax=Pseudoalteromonas amylolytica TaxID=1859457 RepID=A0A1S1MVM3_9GAMM|nr:MULTISPECIES: phage baseplate assembly protein V [Pseudoalteromonas]OHU87841.1 baseplate assembly protein [Pseudoalteromonas sp. JW3]OHU91281.1 baseplate assembly protein [Pseudoalteromonas amylolytica]
MLANPLQSNLAQSDMQSRLAKLISLGTVNEVDYETAKVRVKIGDWLTTWLPWLTNQAFNDMTWQAPEVGEQVVVLAPCGDLAQGVVLGSLYQNGHNLESVANDVGKEERVDVQRTKYQDGSLVEYNRKTHQYLIDVKQDSAVIKLKSAKDIILECDNDLNITVGNNATINVAGDATVNGDKNISVTAADNLSLKGKTVAVEATGGDLKVKASGTLKLNGSTISAQE